jgi:glycosyltransferase involved in cell wall biosynthesis
VVIATSPQLLAGVSGWWLSRVKRVPFILEIRDLWPESLVAVGKSNSVLYPVLSRIARFLYQVSDHIVVVTSSFKEHLVANWHVPGQKISVIENGVDTVLFRPQGSSEIRAALGEEKFVVSYIGTIGNAHGLETVIDAAAQLQQSAPQILFLLVGEGAEKQRIAALAGQKQLGNVRFVGQQPREKVPAFIAASDACLVLLKGAEIFRTVLPTKMLEFMACARPVIAGVDGLARNVVEQANAGICIQPQNSSELASAILRLASDRGLCRKYGENGHGHVLQNFTREQSASLYLEVLSELLEHNRGFAAAAAGAFS